MNHFANFWIPAKAKNQNKSNRHPADFFKDVHAVALKRALIDRELLDYRRITTFAKEREAQLLDVVRKRPVGLRLDTGLKTAIRRREPALTSRSVVFGASGFGPDSLPELPTHTCFRAETRRNGLR